MPFECVLREAALQHVPKSKIIANLCRDIIQHLEYDMSRSGDLKTTKYYHFQPSLTTSDQTFVRSYTNYYLHRFGTQIFRSHRKSF